MKSNVLMILSAVALCVTTGCETDGLSSHERGGFDYPNLVLSLPAPPEGATAPKIIKPIRLAVAQVGEEAPAKEMIHRLETERSLIASVVALPVPVGSPYNNFSLDKRADRTNAFSSQMDSIRNLARGLSADYVFIFGGKIDARQAGNGWKFLDATIIGGSIVPSTKINLEGKAAGALVETQSGRAVFLVNVEAKRDGHSPSYMVQGKADALQAVLRDELGRQLTAEFLQKLTRECDLTAAATRSSH